MTDYQQLEALCVMILLLLPMCVGCGYCFGMARGQRMASRMLAALADDPELHGK